MELVLMHFFLQVGWEVMVPFKGKVLVLAEEDGVEIEGDVVDHAGGKQARKGEYLLPLFTLKWKIRYSLVIYYKFSLMHIL